MVVRLKEGEYWALEPYSIAISAADIKRIVNEVKLTLHDASEMLNVRDMDKVIVKRYHHIMTSKYVQDFDKYVQDFRPWIVNMCDENMALRVRIS